MQSNTKRTIGWILTGLLGFFLLVVSGVPKFIDFPDKAKFFDHLGITAELAPVVGIIEITITIIFLIPRTSFVGAILLTGYLGGAVWTHLRVGDAWFFPIVIGVLVWVALGLRQPAIFALALGQSTLSSSLLANEK
jgi:uncharacterized membrane protein YphA (DoxX/SURF4 family)